MRICATHKLLDALAAAAVLAAVAAALCPAGRAEERAGFAHALNSITADELAAHVDVLADDSFEGREAGSRGGRAAGGYLWRHFERAGLQPAGNDGGYYQSFDSGYRNVLGLWEGSDPQLKHEIILIGAHYDHVGYGNRRNSFGPFGYVHNGADDNASGTAAVLETVDALAAAASPPKRSILLALWDGEEKGLLGSRHWTSHPTLPLERVVLAINIDMIGRMRDDRLQIFGSRSSRGLRRLVSEQNEALALDFSWEMKANSDHHSFFAREIPVLMFHTGLHDDYHRPSDDAHLVNAAGMQQAARLLFRVVWEAAQRQQLDGFRAAARHESPGDQRRLERPLDPPPPRLGVRWNPHIQDGIHLTFVTRGSAADKAGLQVGDRVVEFDGRPVVDAAGFRLAVLSAAAQTQAVVAREPHEEPLELAVELPGQPTRIGVSWRADEAEPGTVVVTRVVAGSAAALAGLQTGDRIYQVAGQSFADSQQLLDLLTSLPAPIELIVERRGRLLPATIDAPPPRS